MAERPQVLIVDDEPNMRRVLAALLERESCEVLQAADGVEALRVMDENVVHVIVADLRMPNMDGLELLKRVNGRDPDLPFIVLTAHGTVDAAVEAMKLGAFDFITKPFEKDELLAVARKAMRSARLDALEPGGPGVAGDSRRHRIIGASSQMQAVFALIEKVAGSPTTVLLTGESGTGKELVARALHAESKLSRQPYIRVNCAAIPRELIESEFFGYEKGAFTGAVTSKPGRFELADGGTLFLDEIGEIPLEMQVKLLRAIQEHEFERVGGLRTLRVNVRLITATNKDLQRSVAEGTFREDLYYRLNVVHIRLPPLRERPEDLPLLCAHFVERFNERLGRRIEGFEPEAMASLRRYHWPGNVRELENLVERCVLFADGARIAPSDLPEEVRGVGGGAPDAADADPMALKSRVRAAAERVERDLIDKALKLCDHNVTRAAKLLRISRKSLQVKMRDLGLREIKET
ncbi:MAG: sigma-54-dependent Fis family transcriptional regulator [Deltaproteobacteria bacterium]|nr:sigma-54-dependent Fis family transcriptional regulator [Deltaproteobacteria bacterium]